ncbi:protein kinase [Actinomadura rudentiformis]|uniref:protein kinase n=1 Tax=Actinomadura rudentiformis TaxID=359158 RepID=UPI00178C56FD|nr:protein kinase [Actinomadura rudentiformis]
MERLDDGGGAREVWRAWDDLLDRIIIVKALGSITPGRHQAFQRQMSKTAGLTHAGIATVYDFDCTRDADGRPVPYVVTEFLEGEDLEARLERAPLALAEALEVCGRIASTLAAAHANGVNHGDLRSSKAILAPGGVKLVDFGTSSAVRQTADDASGQSPDSEPGQASDANSDRESDSAPSAKDDDGAKADIYAFGAVLNECLEAFPAANVPEEVARLSTRCRASDPAIRPSADEAAEILIRAKAASFDTLTFDTTGFVAAPVREPVRTRPAYAGLSKREWALARLGILAIAAIGAVIALAANRPPATAALPEERAATTPTPVYSAPMVPDPQPSATLPSPEESAPIIRPEVTGSMQALDVLGRLKPMVDREFTLGKIRSDVAVDLGNVITNLRNELLQGRQVDLPERLTQLREKIATRLREQGLAQDTADRLTRVLATART